MWFGLAAHSGARVTHNFPTLDILVVVGFSAYYKNEVVALAMYVITHTYCHPHTPPSHPHPHTPPSHPAFTVPLQAWERRSQDFYSFKLATEFRSECQSLKLESLLITPIQRIPRSDSEPLLTCSKCIRNQPLPCPSHSLDTGCCCRTCSDTQRKRTRTMLG